MNEKNRQLGLALDSEEVLLVEQWLAEVLAEGATLPPTDSEGRVDTGALTFRAGQLSVLNKLRGMRAALRPKG